MRAESSAWFNMIIKTLRPPTPCASPQPERSEARHWSGAEGSESEGEEASGRNWGRETEVRKAGRNHWRQRGWKEMGGSPGLVRLSRKQKPSYLHMKSQWHDYTLTWRHTHTTARTHTLIFCYPEAERVVTNTAPSGKLEDIQPIFPQYILWFGALNQTARPLFF